MTVVSPLTDLLAGTPVSLTPKPGTPAYTGGFTTRGPELLPLDAGEQYRFGFSMNACIGCHSCEVACAEQNGLPDGTTWRRVGEIEGGDHPTTKRFHLSMSCNHCLEPACLEGCPTNAYEKLGNGAVVHHADDCIGCQYCTWNCPYSVPAFQPDRRIVTKCDLCQPRLGAGLEPACVGACPTHAITVEKFMPEEWRLDHSQGDAPQLPSASLTLSTTRIELPHDVPIETYAASDWNLRPEHPHWPLVWLTLVSQIAVGVTVALAWGTRDDASRWLAAALAAISLLGAMFHLGRPIAAWKALRNLRRSWLSREVLLLSVFAGVAVGAVVVPWLVPLAAAIGLVGVYASAQLYVVPGRPAWNTPLTTIRFFATALALGPLLAGRPLLAIAGGSLALSATALNWRRLHSNPNQAWLGAFRLETRWFGGWTTARWCLTIAGMGAVAGGWPVPAWIALATGELVGRWLFFVAVVPLNMPGAFWRGAVASHR